MITRTNRLLLFLILLGLATRAAAADAELRQGDWRVSGQETVIGKHLRLNGNLILPKGARLTLEDCVLEIDGKYSRQHTVQWAGGALVTRNCTLGGRVNDAGTPIHTVFHLYDGRWEAIDTEVRYSYGISFHWQQGRGVLRGTRLKAGPRPDAIILSGEADVELVDSDFPIGLGVYCHQGGSTTLDLAPGRLITATFDRNSLLPGVNWRLALTRTRVGRWFLFLRQLGSYHPAAEVTLTRSRDLIVSLLGHNLQGDIHLTRDLATPLHVGNLTLKTAGEPAGISMYALYFSGDKTEVTVRGAAHICELMQRGGKLQVIGTPGKPRLSIGCTTLELSDDAHLEMQHVHLGRPLSWQPENALGEANVTGHAVLTGTDLSLNNVRFRTEEDGRVHLRNVQRHGRLEQQADGGRIDIETAGTTGSGR